ncbi:MAG: hypothetical protein KJ645_08660 [Planctomycetes bacterium]|nr:hypothetical protein [Planctomycetota bacterium]
MGKKIMTSLSPIPWSKPIQAALEATAAFYDARKIGDVGALGFRRSTPLSTLVSVAGLLVRERFLIPGVSNFLDLGCADGRVNVLMSYLVNASVGIEIDEWTLDECQPLKKELESTLISANLPLPPPNCHFIHGDTLEEHTLDAIPNRSGVAFEEIDIFFTYLTLHKEFAKLIAHRGRSGAIFMIYGLDLILPRLNKFELLQAKSPINKKIVLYRKR